MRWWIEFDALYWDNSGYTQKNEPQESKVYVPNDEDWDTQSFSKYNWSVAMFKWSLLYLHGCGVDTGDSWDYGWTSVYYFYPTECMHDKNNLIDQNYRL